MVWINRLPYKPGVAGSIPGFISLSDETLSLVAPSPYDLSCWWDVKQKHNNNNNSVGDENPFSVKPDTEFLKSERTNIEQF